MTPFTGSNLSSSPDIIIENAADPSKPETSNDRKISVQLQNATLDSTDLEKHVYVDVHWALPSKLADWRDSNLKDRLLNTMEYTSALSKGTAGPLAWRAPSGTPYSFFAIAHSVEVPLEVPNFKEISKGIVRKWLRDNHQVVPTTEIDLEIEMAKARIQSYMAAKILEFYKTSLQHNNNVAQNTSVQVGCATVQGSNLPLVIVSHSALMAIHTPPMARPGLASKVMASCRRIAESLSVCLWVWLDSLTSNFAWNGSKDVMHAENQTEPSVRPRSNNLRV